MLSGFERTRRGIADHLQDGRLTLLELGAFEVIRLFADHKTGIWWGSSKALEGKCGHGDITTRSARRLLESLESKGYIKRFATERGRGNYPILINKYECPHSAQSKKRVNAELTIDWRKVKYDVVPTVGPVEGAAPTPSQEVRTKNKEKDMSPTATTEPSHELFRIWQEEHGQLPELKALSPGRLSKCRARMKIHASDTERFLADFRSAVSKASGNAFLAGAKGWRAGFDWFIANEENYKKVLEGNYDDRRPPTETRKELDIGRNQFRRPAVRQNILEREAARLEKQTN